MEYVVEGADLFISLPLTPLVNLNWVCLANTSWSSIATKFKNSLSDLFLISIFEIKEEWRYGFFLKIRENIPFFHKLSFLTKEKTLLVDICFQEIRQDYSYHVFVQLAKASDPDT